MSTTPIDLQLYKLHEAYDKHKLIGKSYRTAAFTSLRQCSCGAWYFDRGDYKPYLCGIVAGRYMAANPSIKASLKDYWTKIASQLPMAATWADVLFAARVARKLGI